MDRVDVGRRSASREALSLAPFLLGYLAFGLYTAQFGFAADADSPGIWRAADAILQGGYLPSRTSGFPAYEGLVALLRALGADVVMVAVATAGLGVAAFLVALWCSPDRSSRLALAVLFCASPVIVTNASSVMETNLTLLTVALYLGLHLKLCALSGGPGRRLVVMAVLCGWAVVMSRIDASIIVTASLGALFLKRRQPVYLVMLAGIGLASFASYGLIRGDLEFIGVFRNSFEPAGRSIAKAGIGVVALLWSAGAVAVALLFLNRRRLSPELALFLALAAALYAIRFAVLPDELEYLLPMYFTTIVLAARTTSWRQIACAAPLAVAGMLTTPLLFEKPDTIADSYRVSPALGPPGVVADLRRRVEINTEMQGDYWHWLEGQAGTPLRRHMHNGFLTSPDGRTLVVFRDAAHLFLSPRWQHRRPVSAYDRVILCAAARRQPYGWRQLRHPLAVTAVGTFIAGGTMRCDLLAGPVDRDRYIEAARLIWPDARPAR